MARMTVGELELAYDLTGTGRPFVWGHGLSSSRAREDAIDLVTWHSLQTGSSGSKGPSKRLHYEEDFYGSLTLGFAGGVALSGTYSAPQSCG